MDKRIIIQSDSNDRSTDDVIGWLKFLASDIKIQISFKQEMAGTANIITEDLRLIERFFYQLRAVFNR